MKTSYTALLLGALFLTGCVDSGDGGGDEFGNQDIFASDFSFENVRFDGVEYFSGEELVVTKDAAFDVEWVVNSSSLYRMDFYLTSGDEAHADSNRIAGINCGSGPITYCPNTVGNMQCVVSSSKISCSVDGESVGSETFGNDDVEAGLKLVIRGCDGFIGNCTANSFDLSVPGLADGTQVGDTSNSPADNVDLGSGSLPGLLNSWSFDDNSNGWELINTELGGGNLKFDGYYESSYRVQGSSTGEYSFASVPDISYEKLTIALRVKPEEKDDSAIIVAGTTRWISLEQIFGVWALRLNNGEHTFTLDYEPVWGVFNDVIITVDVANSQATVTINDDIQTLRLPDGFALNSSSEECRFSHCSSGLTFTNYSNGKTLKGEVDWVLVGNDIYTKNQIDSFVATSGL